MTRKTTTTSATIYQLCGRSFRDANCQWYIEYYHQVVLARRATSLVMMNHADIDNINPKTDPYIHFFALSTPVLSPVIPLANCIRTAW